MGAGESSEDERPVHRVVLDEFHISVREVTNEAYACFVRRRAIERRRSTRSLSWSLMVGATGHDRFGRSVRPMCGARARRRLTGFRIR